jgi:hypothetical protein
MIELVTLFVPIAIVCKDMSVKNCEMIQYQGHFSSEKECQDIIDNTLKSKLLKKDRNRVHIDTWCINVEIEGVDKKYLPKLT